MRQQVHRAAGQVMPARGGILLQSLAQRPVGTANVIAIVERGQAPAIPRGEPRHAHRLVNGVDVEPRHEQPVLEGMRRWGEPPVADRAFVNRRASRYHDTPSDSATRTADNAPSSWNPYRQ